MRTLISRCGKFRLSMSEAVALRPKWELARHHLEAQALGLLLPMIKFSTSAIIDFGSPASVTMESG